MAKQGLRSGKDPIPDRAELISIIREVMREEIESALNNKLLPIEKSLDSLKKATNSMTTKIKDLETAANAMEVRATTLEQKYAEVVAENMLLKQTMDSIENHSRKFNVRCMGLSTGLEKGKPTALMDTVFRELFGDQLGVQPLVNIAHRTGAQAVSPAKPRCMIVRLFSLETKNLILRLARESKGKLLFQGKKISIYPDLSAELIKKRAEFNDIRTCLREAKDKIKDKIKFGITFPCKLLVTFDDETHSFTDPTEAMVYYEQSIKPTLTSED